MGNAKRKQTRRSGVVGRVKLPGGRKADMVYEADPDGRPVAHARTVDTIARMRKSGTITPAMYDAARDFQAQFTIAALDVVPTMPLIRVTGGRKSADLSDQQVAARERVHRALEALGGIDSPAGSCLWHVVGLQVSLRQWVARRCWGGRPLRHESAQGILIAALGLLAVLYGYERPRSPSRVTRKV